jgi:DNA-binding CsgD family transcriptional regulator
MSGKSKIPDAELLALHAKGLHPSEIAPHLGVHRSTVEHALLARGLTWEKRTGGIHKLTEEQVQEICTRYQAGEGATSLARDFGVDKRAIYHWLNKVGGGTRTVASRRRATTGRTSRLSERDMEIAVSYAAGEGIEAIAARLECHESTVRYSLSKQGAFQAEDRSTAVRQSVRVPVPPEDRHDHDPGLRHDAFDTLTPEAAYWAGFILADGCLSCPIDRTPRIMMGLHKGDEDHLRTFAQWIGTERQPFDAHPVTFGKQRNITRLQITSRQLMQRLNLLGITEGKEGRAVVPSLAASRDFWRGLVDGDGSIRPDGTGVYLSGQIGILEGWARFCDEVCKDTGCVLIRIQAQHQGCFVGRVRSVPHSRKVLRHLYQGATVALARKAQRAALA